MLLAVRDVTTDNFGLLIAYLLPGFVCVWGVSFFSSTVASWLGAAPDAAPTVGGFLYVTLGSTAAGLIVSAVRWVVLDRLFRWTGIHEPRWDFSRLPGRLQSFLAIVENHYRYYQSYSNMLVAVAFVYALRIAAGAWSIGWADLGFLAIAIILFAGARDTLRKYYTRGAALLGASDGRTAPRTRTVPEGGASQDS